VPAASAVVAFAPSAERREGHLREDDPLIERHLGFLLGGDVRPDDRPIEALDKIAAPSALPAFFSSSPGMVPPLVRLV
jgi:hypothetical protein